MDGAGPGKIARRPVPPPMPPRPPPPLPPRRPSSPVTDAPPPPYSETAAGDDGDDNTGVGISISTTPTNDTDSGFVSPALSPISTTLSGTRSPPGLGRSTSPGLRPPNWPYSQSPYLSPDPRSSSAQSLVSHVASDDTRRTLLLVYIHGFYGNSQSFRSFPYHVHSFLRITLADTHIIHSKIYPRYKTYRAIEVARDNFSQWLQPHESPTTDIILVGHSMGGILAADVVLMHNTINTSNHPFKHRILGTISLDSPFLGLHPGIIVSGIASLFQSSPQPPQQQQQQQQQGEASGSSAPDPHFDPPFFNDRPFKEAPFIKRLTNFAHKHRPEGLMNATAKHVLSHLEYGGCLADFAGLKARYAKIRALEDVDELKGLGDEKYRLQQQLQMPHTRNARVRFVNYYTLSSGRTKKPKPKPKPQTQTQTQVEDSNEADDQKAASTQDFAAEGPSRRPSTLRSTTTTVSTISITTDDYHTSPLVLSDEASFMSRNTSTTGDGDGASISPITDMSSRNPADTVPIPDDQIPEAIHNLGLPPLPDLPAPPAGDINVILDGISDESARRQVETELRRAQRSYDRAVMDRNRAIRERIQLVEKMNSGGDKNDEDTNSADQNEQGGKVRPSTEGAGSDRESSPSSSTTTPRVEVEGVELPDSREVEESKDGNGGEETKESGGKDKELEKTEKKEKRKKKFCTLPRSSRSSEQDPTWVDVYMEGMDEVTAHTSLFFAGEHYDRLVGDVASRITGWVEDDLSRRTVMEMEGYP